MINNSCRNQQLCNWHFRTVCRYTLVETPILKLKPFSQKLKNIVDYLLLNSNVNSRLNTCENGAAVLADKSNKYNLCLNSVIIKNKNIPKVYLNHIQLWGYVNKIGLHITSGKLLYNMELYASFYIAFCCCGHQSPQITKSKKSVAGFNVIKAAVTGVKNTLRNKSKLSFAYKWAFLSGGKFSSFVEYANFKTTNFKRKIVPPIRIKKKISYWGRCFGINNVFIFPELDKFNYDLFEPITGLDVAFYFNCFLNKRVSS